MRDVVRLLRAWWHKRRLCGFLAITRIYYSSSVWWASITIPKKLAREIWANKPCLLETRSGGPLDDELCIMVPLTPLRNADGVPYHELAKRRRVKH